MPRRVRIPTLLVVGLLAAGAIVAVLGHRLPGSPRASVSAAASMPTAPSALPAAPSTVASPMDVPPGERRDALGEGGMALPQGAAVGEHRGPLGEADGAVPKGTTVFDDAVPGVTNLDPSLLDALRSAGTAAARSGVELDVDSGWRSPAYQAQLLRQAVAKYGSAEVAARWVATPTTSAHVSGDAVDIGPSRAAAWLSRHGASYGLCQIYRNEPWHYERRPDAVTRGCPAMYADPTHDPRMQR